MYCWPSPQSVLQLSGMAFIRTVTTASGATAVQIAHKQSGRIVKIEHIGSAHSEHDLQSLLTLAREQLHRGQLSLFPTPHRLGVVLKRSSSDLLFRSIREHYSRLGFEKLDDELFALLCVARIVEPTSKLDSIRVLSDLALETIRKDSVYRCLARIVSNNYQAVISQACCTHANANSLSLLLYDVTTLYFEVQKEDTFRKPGMSKERRLEPQIVVGLLVNKNGFPLALHSFEGNKAETKTILPVVTEFCTTHNLHNVTIVADAGMMSESNLSALTTAGYHYIVGSRLGKIPYAIAEFQKTQELTDNQIVEARQSTHRIIYQYKQKRASLDIKNIRKQVDKAQKVIDGTIPTKKAKFLTAQTKGKKLNQKLINKAYALAGIKGYVTNLDIPNETVIASYHQLFQVEASFRMAKSDLKARPIFHRKRDSIEAHLTIVFASLAIARDIEALTGLSIKKFVQTLRPIRAGVVSINGQEYIAEEEIPSDVENVLKKLRKKNSGH